MAVIVSAKDLGIGYPRHPVGRDLTLGIEADKVTMLLGPNGCGKTTLFRTILGILPSQAGAVLLEGAPLTRMRRKDVAQRLAYVPQVTQGYFPFSVMDVVLMGRAPFLGTFEHPGAQDRDVARAAMDQVGVSGIAERPFTAISGGQRQLTLIARALAQSAQVLIMDEPTANLDYGNQHRMLARAVELASDGRAVVISTHNPEHAFTYADHVILMKAGQIIAAGAAPDVLDSATLSDVYDLPVSVSTVDPGDGHPRTVVTPR